MIGQHAFYTDILLVSLYSVLFAGISYIAGVFIFNCQSQNPGRKAFYNLVLGTLVIIDLYSIVCTGFKTVNSLSLAVLIYIALDNRKYAANRKIDIKPLLPLLLIFPVVFLLYGIHILPESIETDVKYYAKISHALSATGYENFYHYYNNYNDSFHGITAYHYIEFWFASFFHTLTGSMSIFSLKYFSYPFLISLVVYGFICQLRSARLLFIPLVIVLSLFPLHSYISIANTGWEMYTDFWLRPNFIPYYLAFALLYHAMQDKNYKLFYAFVALSLTFSVILLLVALISVALLTAVFFIRKQFSLRQSVMYLCPALLVTLGLLLFYKLFGSPINVSTSGIKLKDILLHSAKIWKAVAFTIVMLIAQGGIIVLLAYVFNRFIKKEKDNYFPLFIFLLLITGVILFQVLNKMDNSYQFTYFAYAGIGFLFMTVFTGLIDQIEVPVLKFSALTAVLMIAFLAGHYNFNTATLNSTLASANLDNENTSVEWRKNFSTYLSQHRGAKGGFVFSSGLKDILKPKDRICINKQAGSYICYLTEDCNLPSITCRDSILLGYSEKNAEAYEKSMNWMNAFPDFTENCSPESYLRSKKFDYFFCHIRYPVSDPLLKIIPDTLRQMKVVYRD